MVGISEAESDVCGSASHTHAAILFIEVMVNVCLSRDMSKHEKHLSSRARTSSKHLVTPRVMIASTSKA